MLAWLDRQRFLILCAVAFVLAAGILASSLSLSEPEQVVFETGPQLAPGSPIRVHVGGAVVSPGVYELRAGDRIDDAVTAAGGPAAGADLDAINLARHLRDAEQVIVPGASSAPARFEELAPGEKLDINSATQAQLDSLPGIGEAYSRRIVDSRLLDGPYGAIEDLVTRNVVPQATFDAIRDLIRAGP
jgi:competence protein ComEA